MVGETDKLDNEIDLRELLAIIWSGKYFITISTFATIVYALFVTISTDKLYTARAVLSFVKAAVIIWTFQENLEP